MSTAAEVQKRPNRVAPRYPVGTFATPGTRPRAFARFGITRTATCPGEAITQRGASARSQIPDDLEDQEQASQFDCRQQHAKNNAHDVRLLCRALHDALHLNG